MLEECMPETLVLTVLETTVHKNTAIIKHNSNFSTKLISLYHLKILFLDIQSTKSKKQFTEGICKPYELQQLFIKTKVHKQNSTKLWHLLVEYYLARKRQFRGWEKAQKERALA